MPDELTRDALEQPKNRPARSAASGQSAGHHSARTSGLGCSSAIPLSESDLL